jgi:DNA-binding NtrC family response regulator
VLQPGLKVVLITGHGTREVIGEAMEDKINGILVKPFTPDELTHTVAAALA